MNERWCSGCQRNMNRRSFYVLVRGKNGRPTRLDGYCKRCRHSIYRSWYRRAHPNLNRQPAPSAYQVMANLRTG